MLVEVNGKKEYVDRYNELWDHTLKRVNDAYNKAKDYDDFVNKMVTRLKRITHREKIIYAIAVLRNEGHDRVVDIYEGKLIIDELTKQH